jgi:hypothetical protein
MYCRRHDPMAMSVTLAPTCNDGAPPLLASAPCPLAMLTVQLQLDLL